MGKLHEFDKRIAQSNRNVDPKANDEQLGSRLSSSLQHNATLRHMLAHASRASPTVKRQAVFHLQRTVGNQAVQRMISSLVQRGIKPGDKFDTPEALLRKRLEKKVDELGGEEELEQEVERVMGTSDFELNEGDADQLSKTPFASGKSPKSETAPEWNLVDQIEFGEQFVEEARQHFISQGSDPVAHKEWIDSQIQLLIKKEKEIVEGSVGEAWKSIIALVEPEVLNSIKPPKIIVHSVEGEDFRPYCTDDGMIHVRSDEYSRQIAHEFGHHLENNLPPEHWLSLVRLLQSRSKGGNDNNNNNNDDDGKFIKYEGESGLSIKSEGEADVMYPVTDMMPATGDYSGVTYDDGATELMSRSLEFLSSYSSFEDFVKDDPELARILLRALRPNEAKESGLAL